MENYTYKQYKRLYRALGGVTTHFSPVAGIRRWHKKLFSRQEFEKQLARLNEINSRDEEWLFKNHPHNYIDVFESEMWESHKLRSDLFVIEIERYEKIQGAMRGVIHLKIIIAKLQAALVAAYDHLGYCGFGDKWERECAKAEGLEETIRAALHAAQEDCPPKE